MNTFLVGKTLIDSSRGVGKLVVDYTVWMSDVMPCVTLHCSDGEDLEWDCNAGDGYCPGGGAWVDEDGNEYKEAE